MAVSSSTFFVEDDTKQIVKRSVQEYKINDNLVVKYQGGC